MRLLKGLITAALAAALLAVPAAALAKHRHHSHVRALPAAWAKRHHLNVHAVNKDPDHDGLSNISEFRDGTNPRKADTDGDGVNDGTEVEDNTNPDRDDADEVSGTIASFENGVLTIQPAGQGAQPVSGMVNDMTRIACDNENEDAPASQPSATMSRDGSEDGGSGDNSGPGSGDTSGSGTSGSDDGANHESGDNNNTTQPGADNQGENENENEDNNCSSADLKPGATVHEAKLMKTMDGSTVFTKIELFPAA